MSREGRLVAVCVGGPGERWKREVPEAALNAHGLDGDRHAGPTRRSGGRELPNDRQVSVVAAEAARAFDADLGTSLRPGDLGENLLVEGLGDLSDLGGGEILRVGDAAVLRVTGQNEPCANLMDHHRLLVKRSYGRRGVVATVVAGAGAVLRPGDRVTLEP